ncbi:hypothetical protein BDV12DRAFT_158737, partial [Aspergillus spectabilis]
MAAKQSRVSAGLAHALGFAHGVDSAMARCVALTSHIIALLISSARGWSCSSPGLPLPNLYAVHPARTGRLRAMLSLNLPMSMAFQFLRFRGSAIGVWMSISVRVGKWSESACTSS